MKKLTSITAVVLLAGGLVACNSPGERAVGGGLIGAGTGALIGSAVTGGRASGAWAGAAIGGITGAAVGASTAQPSRECARWRRDYYGNPVCVAYY